MKLILVLLISGFLVSCSHFKEAMKLSPSVTSFAGFTEFPKWHNSSLYTYPESDWIPNDFKLRMHYRDMGEGPVIVLLHGEFGSLHIWEAWMDYLTEEFRVIALDLPGSGLTGSAVCYDDPEEYCPEQLSFEYQKHTLEYFIKDLNLTDFTLVGHSLGAFVAADYAIDNPNALKNLVLISPLGMAQQEIPEIVDFASSPATSLIAKYFQPTTMITTYLYKAMGEPEKVTEGLIRRYIHLNQSRGSKRTNVANLKLVNQLMQGKHDVDFSQIAVPTMLLWGGLDRWGDEDLLSQWETSIADALAVEYPFSGNLTMLEIPDKSVIDVIAFMNEEPIPTVVNAGLEGAFTIDSEARKFEEMNLFETETEEIMEDEAQ